jgi:transposase
MRRRDARSLPPTAQEDIRRKAVRAVKAGRSQVEVAELFGVTRHSVGRWIANTRQHGLSALKARKRGRPAEISLEPWQAAWVVKRIVDRTPDQLRLPFYLWTRHAVKELIELEFGIQLSVWTIGRYLRRWGFTPQKPIRKAFEQNPEDVRRWLKEEYPEVCRRARLEGAEIYWGDETGMRSDHAAGRSWGRRGQTPVIKSSGQRFSCSMISAITNRGRLNFMVFQKKFEAKVFVGFLRRLIRQSGRKVFFIADRHPVHRSSHVKRWLSENAKNVRMIFLPAYSPELNPDELLNQDVKTNGVGRRPARDAIDLMNTVRGYVRSIQRRPQHVSAYFNEHHVRYASMQPITCSP